MERGQHTKAWNRALAEARAAKARGAAVVEWVSIFNSILIHENGIFVLPHDVIDAVEGE